MTLDDNDLVIVLGFVLLFICILAIISLINRNDANDYPNECMYADASEMNNGDIVLVSYTMPAGAFITSFSRSIWSHTGTIWVDPKTNIRYVLEGAIYRYKKYRHFFKIPLETWLFFNRKFLIGYKKYHGPQIDSEYLWSKFEWLNKSCKLEGFNIFWSRFLVNKEYYEYTKHKNYSCLEGTVILGQSAGIYKKDKIYCSYFPGDIANNKINLVDGVSYDLPIQIAIHPTNSLLFSEDLVYHIEMWKN